MNTLSKTAYYGIILAWTVATLAFTAYVATHTDGFEPSLKNFGIYMGIEIVASMVVGGALYRQSLILMLIGWVGSMVPVGVGLAWLVQNFELPDMTNTFIVAGAVTLCSGLVGMFLPWKLERWGAWVILGMIAAMALQIGIAFFGLFGAHALEVWGVINHALVLFFCVMMMVEFSEASRRPRTVVNAMYTGQLTALVIINLVERLMDPLSSKK